MDDKFEAWYDDLIKNGLNDDTGRIYTWTKRAWAAAIESAIDKPEPGFACHYEMDTYLECAAVPYPDPEYTECDLDIMAEPICDYAGELLRTRKKREDCKYWRKVESVKKPGPDLEYMSYDPQN